MMTMNCLLLLCVLILLNELYAFQDHFKPNKDWEECVDCGDEWEKEIIYGMIKHAIYTESREVYLNFDHSWLDRAVIEGRKFVIKNVKRKELSSLVMPAYEPPETEAQEKFYVVISKAHDEENIGPLNQEDAEIIDEFLTHNPCWIPIKDPAVSLYKGKTDPDKRYNKYEGSAIFIRLPAYGYHSTCQLYQYIHDKQFPEKCPSKDEDDKVWVNWLGNIGWANCVHPLVEHFMDAMHNMKVYLTPRAWENGAMPILKVKVNGEEVVASGPWGAWADMEECPIDTYAWNPWHCHFISLSSCNTPELHDKKFIESRLEDPKGGSDYLKRLEQIKFDRLKYGDGFHLGNEWEYSRYVNLVQRPNIHARARLRLALDNLVSLTMLHKDPDNYEKNMQHHHVQMVPCIAMHVRHGDAQNDARGEMTVDRSLKRHVDCAHHLGIHQGANNVFLATDDNKLFNEAPEKYPVYHWYSQHRKLKDFTGASFGYRNEDTAQSDVMNMMADLILASRCQGLVGAFDGGFLRLLLQYQCGRSPLGRCPPSADIAECI